MNKKILVITVITLLGVLALFFLRQADERVDTQTPERYEAEETRAEETFYPSLSVDGKVVASTSISQESSTEEVSLDRIPTSRLSVSQISHIEKRGSLQELVLIDGSRRTLTDDALTRLPNSVQRRASYERPPQ